MNLSITIEIEKGCRKSECSERLGIKANVLLFIKNLLVHMCKQQDRGRVDHEYDLQALSAFHPSLPSVSVFSPSRASLSHGVSLSAVLGGFLYCPIFK